jgi:hypothetical protein
VLFVASQLGRLGVSVRPLEGAGDPVVGLDGGMAPMWASDVSPALKKLGASQPPPFTTGSSVEKSIRKVPPPGVTLAAPIAAAVGATQ